MPRHGFSGTYGEKHNGRIERIDFASAASRKRARSFSLLRHDGFYFGRARFDGAEHESNFAILGRIRRPKTRRLSCSKFHSRRYIRTRVFVCICISLSVKIRACHRTNNHRRGDDKTRRTIEKQSKGQKKHGVTNGKLILRGSRSQVRYDDEDEDEGPQPDPMFEQGGPLPVRLHNEFPPELSSTPLEDIDSFYHNQRVSAH